MKEITLTLLYTKQRKKKILFWWIYSIAYTAFRWSGYQYSTPTKDFNQNLQHTNISYTNGNIMMHFVRARNTNDPEDHKFSDSDCYHFFFPVRGGNFQNGRIMHHFDTPKISGQKICINAASCVTPGKYMKFFPNTYTANELHQTTSSGRLILSSIWVHP